MQKNTGGKNPPSNTFTRTLAEFNGGGSLQELSTHMTDLLAAVRATGKAGKLTYEVTIKPASRGDGITVSYHDDIKVKMPRSERPTGIFFITEENTLQRNDPRQQEMALRAVEKPQEEGLRAVNG